MAEDAPEDISTAGPARARRHPARGALVAAVGAAVIAGAGPVAAAAEPSDPSPGVGSEAGTAVQEDARHGADEDPRGGAGQDADRETAPAGAEDTAGGITEGTTEDAAEDAGVPAGSRPAAPDLEPAVAYALRHIGDPYAFGAEGPHSWDCSGLVQQAYRRAGVRLPRLAADQYRATRHIPRSALRRGDLVFWSTDGRASGVHHVAIYAGGGRYIEAARPGTRVRVSTLAYYPPQLYGRVVGAGPAHVLLGEDEADAHVTCSDDAAGCG
ncbi:MULTISPECIES: C40 family peptidase [Streptomyces]|uniref:NlpC/P60 domain-containing protein n=1 Tax=Streptomyces luteosporeus TaxID=173856 RepID=A0ABP6G3C8_9ACTN